MITLEIPIEYMNCDPKIKILDTSVNVVNLNLSGSGTIIKTIRPDQVNVKLDLSKAIIGHNTYTITKENITLPPDTFLKGVKPAFDPASLKIAFGSKDRISIEYVVKKRLQ